MNPEEMYALLHQEPFRPIRLHLKDGNAYEIRHRELTMVTRLAFVLGIPQEGAPDVRAGQALILDWQGIDRVEPIADAASGS